MYFKNGSRYFVKENQLDGALEEIKNKVLNDQICSSMPLRKR